MDDLWAESIVTNSVQFFEVDQPFCVKEYGKVNSAGLCQAQLTVTGDRKCFNTRVTCQDSANFDTEPRLFFTGLSGDSASTPTVIGITGHIDIRARVRLNDWTPIGDQALVTKWLTTGNQLSYFFGIAAISGALLFKWTTGGSSATQDTRNSTIGHGFADGSTHWVRVTFWNPNTDGNHQVDFYKSEDGITWTNLGSVAIAGTVSIFDGTAPLMLGSTANATSPLDGNIYLAEVRSGLAPAGAAIPVGGQLVARFDPAKADVAGQKKITIGGLVWTINGNARVDPGLVRLRFAEQQEGLAAYGNVIPLLRGPVSTTAGSVNLGGMDQNMSALGVRESISVMMVNAKSSDLLVDKYRLERRTGVAQTIVAAYISLPGTVGNYVSTPDSGSIDVTGDIDIRCKAALNDWTPAVGVTTLVAKRGAPPQRSFMFRVATTGVLELSWSADGTNLISAASTVAPTIADGAPLICRVTMDVNDGAGNRVLKFWTSTNYNPMDRSGTWTQLGATVTTAGVTSIFNSTAPLEMGSAESGNLSLMAGKFYWGEVLDGIDNPFTAALFDANAGPDGITGGANFSTVTGEFWFLNGTALIVNADGYDPYLLGGFVTKFVARNPYYLHYPCRVRDGEIGQELSVMDVREYILNKIDGPSDTGEATFTAKDMFSLLEAKKAVCPKASLGELSANMAASGVTTFTLLPSGIGATYYAAGYVVIGDEAIQYTRSGDTCTVVARTALGSTNSTHDVEDVVQQAEPFVLMTPSDIAYRLMTTFGEVPLNFFDKAAYDASGAAIPDLYTAYICKPTPTNELLASLSQIGVFTLYPNISTGLIEFLAFRVGASIKKITDTIHSLKGTKVDVQPQYDRRSSQVWVYYGKKNHLKDNTDKLNYHGRVVPSDLLSEGDDQYGSPAIKEILTPWLPQFARSPAELAGERILFMHRDPPVQVTMTVRKEDFIDVPVGRYIDMQVTEIQDFIGAPLTQQYAVFKTKKTRTTNEFTANRVRFSPEDDGTRRIFIESDLTDFNLRTAHDSVYGPPPAGSVVELTVEGGIFVGGGLSNGSVAALEIGSWPAGISITVKLFGEILPRGGEGGTGGGIGVNGFPGTNGAPGLRTTVAITLTGTGIIRGGFGGGGGGGGGLSEWSAGIFRGAGGGGGGGARGFPGGAPGVSNFDFTGGTNALGPGVALVGTRTVHGAGTSGCVAAEFPTNRFTVGGRGGDGNANGGASTEVGGTSGSPMNAGGAVGSRGVAITGNSLITFTAWTGTIDGTTTGLSHESLDQLSDG